MNAEALFYGSHDCLVKAPKDKLVVVEDLDDYIIVDEKNVLLICKKENQNGIRRFVNDIQINMGEKFV